MNARMAVFILIVYSFLLAGNPIAQEKTGEYEGDSEPEFKCVGDAKDLAVKYLGFNKMAGFSEKSNLGLVEKVTILNDKTPFLNNEINGKEIWRIEFNNIRLELNSIPHAKDKYNRKFVVYINKESGKLLKIESNYEGDDKDFLPEPSIEHAESQLRSTGEIYINFPDSGNFVSFYDALNSYGNLSARQISAHLVTITRSNNDDIVVWSITFRGITPQIAKGRYGNSVAEYYRNYIRNVYDARTGKLLYSTTIPTVEPVNKK